MKSPLQDSNNNGSSKLDGGRPIYSGDTVNFLLGTVSQHANLMAEGEPAKVNLDVGDL